MTKRVLSRMFDAYGATKEFDPVDPSLLPTRCSNLRHAARSRGMWNAATIPVTAMN